MPLIGSRGAASATGFGLFSSATGAAPFLATISSPANQVIYGSATDSQNNIIMVSGAGNNALIKVSKTGTTLWAKSFALQFCTLNAVTVDSSDNIYVVGELFSPGNYGLIMKFDSSGTLLWQYQQNPGNATYYPRGMSWKSVKVMPNGNIAVAGVYKDNTRTYVCCCGYVQVNVDFGALAIYNSSGTLQWARKFGTTSIGTNGPLWSWLTVGVDSSNNLYVSGVGGNINSGGSRAVPIIKYDSTGVYQWGYQYKNSSSTVSWDGVLNVGPDNNIYAASSSVYQSYALMVNSSGTYQWARNFSGSSRQAIFNQIAFDSVGSAYYGGGAYDPATSDVYNYGLYKIDNAGTLQYARRVGFVDTAGQNEVARSVAVSADNFITLGGSSDARSAELFTRLKTDGSGTGTYSISGVNYSYANFAISAVSDVPSVTNATSTYPNTSGDFAMTYTSSTSTVSPASLTPTINVTPI
jgi:hypothetical protein